MFFYAKFSLERSAARARAPIKKIELSGMGWKIAQKTWKNIVENNAKWFKSYRKYRPLVKREIEIGTKLAQKHRKK